MEECKILTNHVPLVLNHDPHVSEHVIQTKNVSLNNTNKHIPESRYVTRDTSICLRAISLSSS